MAVQDRVAVLEGRVAEHSQIFDGIQAQVRAFEERVDRRFEGVDRRLNDIDAKESRHFLWLVGLLITTLAASLTAAIALLPR